MKSVFRMQPAARSTNSARCGCGNARTGSAASVMRLFRWLNVRLSMRKAADTGEGTEMIVSLMRMASHRTASVTRVAIARRVASAFSLIFLLALLLTPSLLDAQTGYAIHGQAVTPYGTPATNAKITVCPYTATGTPCSPQSNIYSNAALSGSPLPQPYSTDQYGNYSFWVTPGLSYLVEIKISQTVVYSYFTSSGVANVAGVTSFSAPAASWPTWLVPTVTNPTTTPSLAVTASAIPNAALANDAITINSVPCTLGGTCSISATPAVNVNGSSVSNPNFNGSTPAPDAGYTAATWKVSGSNVIAELPTGAGSPLTTKGDLYTFSTVNTRLPVGTDGQSLLADSAQTTGLRWGTPASSGVQYNPAATSYIFTSGSLFIVDGGNSCQTGGNFQAKITSYSITTGVGTFNYSALADPTAGNTLTLSQFGTSTFLNGVDVTVLAGVTAGTFTANISHADVGLTTETGVGDCAGSVPMVASKSPFMNGHGTVVDSAIAGGTIAALVTAYPTSVRPFVQAAVAAGAPAYVFVMPTANEWTSSCPVLATLEASYLTYFADIHADGGTVVGVAGPDEQLNTTFCATAYLLWAQLNDWFKAQGKTLANTASGQYWDFPADATPVLTNSSDANYYMQTGPFTGHFTSAGATRMAAMIAQSVATKGTAVGTDTYGRQTILAPLSVTGASGANSTLPVSITLSDTTTGATIGWTSYNFGGSTGFPYQNFDGNFVDSFHVVTGGISRVLPPTSSISWNQGGVGAFPIVNAPDVMLYRDSSGVLAVGTNAIGTANGSMKMTNLTLSGTCTGCVATVPLSSVTAGSSPSGTFDFSGATQLKLPVAAGYASLAQGEQGYDSTNLNWHFWLNGADNFIAGFSVATPPTTGDCAQFTKTTNSWTLTSAGGPCGIGGSGLSGMTAGQVPIAATASTVTSSKALAGAGAGITTGPTSSTSGDVATMTGTAGQIADSGILLSSLAPLVSPAFTTPSLGAAAATSLLASGIVDGTAPLTITTGTTATLGGTYKSGYTYNQEATAATGVTYTLPTAAAGLQYCIGNSYNGSAPTTGILTLATSATGQFIIFTDGTLSATGGNVTSGGAAADAACVVGIDATHWQLYVSRGTWTKH